MTSYVRNIMSSSNAVRCYKTLDNIARKVHGADEDETGHPFTICNPRTPEQFREVVDLLENGLQEDILAEILQHRATTPSSPEVHRGLTIMLVLVSMMLGANINPELMDRARRYAYGISDPFCQLQVLTAVNEYKNNGTPWVFEDRCSGDEVWNLEDLSIGRGMGYVSTGT